MMIPHRNHGAEQWIIAGGDLQRGLRSAHGDTPCLSPALLSAQPTPTFWNNYLIMDTSLQVLPDPGLPGVGVNKFALCHFGVFWGLF